jgi:hypothetical protein
MFGSIEGVKLSTPSVSVRLTFANYLYNLVDHSLLSEFSGDNLDDIVGWFLLNYFENNEKANKASYSMEKFYKLVSNI